MFENLRNLYFEVEVFCCYALNGLSILLNYRPMRRLTTLFTLIITATGGGLPRRWVQPAALLLHCGEGKEIRYTIYKKKVRTQKVRTFSIANTISRVLYSPEGEPLSFIYDCGHPQPLATYPPTLGEQPLIVGIYGLATRKAYCQTTLLPLRWALTPPFHPYQEA